MVKSGFSQQIRLLPRLMFDRVLPAVFWLWFAGNSINTLVHTVGDDTGVLALARQASSAAFLVLVGVLFLVRRPPVGQRSRPIEAVVAIIGTFSLVFIASLPPVHEAPAILAAGTTVALLGLLWSILSLAALGRCFGIFPEARGLVTRGPYRLVRHPLYLGEIVMGLGILLPVLSPATAAGWMASTAMQLWRALNEERALAGVFAEYTTYQARTRRLIPFVW